MKRVGMLYHQKDVIVIEDLCEHLSGMKRRKVIELVGAPGAEQIDEKGIDECDILLICISGKLLSSSHHLQLEQHAIHLSDQGKIRVVPVILSVVDYQRDFPELEKLNPFPRDGKPVATFADKDVAYAQIAGAVRTIVEKANTSPRTEEQKTVVREEKPISPPPSRPFTQSRSHTQSRSTVEEKSEEKRTSVLVYYAVEDKQLAQKISRQVKSAGLNPVDIESTTAAHNRRASRESMAKESDAILFLISADFLFSDSLDNEIQRILSQTSKPIFALIIRYVSWESSWIKSPKVVVLNNGKPALDERARFLSIEELQKILKP